VPISLMSLESQESCSCIHLMPEDISKLARLIREDAHRTGLTRHHTGTSSKRPPEAIRGEDMKAQRRRGNHRYILGVPNCGEGQLDYLQADTVILTILRDREGYSVGRGAGGA
jgi:hypothetical protein